MNQQEAIEHLRKLSVGAWGTPSPGTHEITCTGDINTCPNDECLVCGVRDCEFHEPLHYHHDGCPSCDQEKI